MTIDLWWAGLAIGLTLAFGRAILEYTATGSVDLGLFTLLTGLGTGATPSIVALFRGMCGVLVALRDLQPEPPRPEPVSPQPVFAATTPIQQMALVRDHHWRQMAHRFITAGDKYGFGVRVLARTGSASKVVSWGGWGEMTRVLRDAGVLAGSGDGTKWASDWDYSRWLAERDRLPLPHPAAEPPDVLITVNSATQQRSATPANTAIIEG